MRGLRAPRRTPTPTWLRPSTVCGSLVSLPAWLTWVTASVVAMKTSKPAPLTTSFTSPDDVP